MPNLNIDGYPKINPAPFPFMFRDTLSDEFLTQLRRNTNACTVIGNDRFRKQIAAMLGREVPTGKRGRPRKQS